MVSGIIIWNNNLILKSQSAVQTMYFIDVKLGAEIIERINIVRRELKRGVDLFLLLPALHTIKEKSCKLKTCKHMEYYKSSQNKHSQFYDGCIVFMKCGLLLHQLTQRKCCDIELLCIKFVL